MTELQAKILDMLKWFDHYCREQKLTYYAVGGTLLGAVRHKGFIPWDDDIDLAMPRKDFERLGELMGGKQTDQYILETYQSENKDFCYPYNKLYDTTTTMIENYHKPLCRGIFLDIFPLDGAGNTEEEGYEWCRHINAKYHFYLTRMASISKSRKSYKNAAILVSRMIPGFIVDNTEYRKKINEECRKRDISAYAYSGNLLGNWGLREVVPTSVIGKPTEYTFEDTSIYGIEDYDAYLTHIYGDWRKQPPKEKQVSQHDFLKLDLHHSYLDTMGE